MNRRLLFTTFFLVSTIVGQMPSDAMPIDVFGKVTCEDLIARSDGLYQRLSADSTSRAFVVINPEFGKQDRAEIRGKLIHSRFQFGKAEHRISYIFGEEKPSIQTTYWIVPADAADPIVVGRRWVEPVSDVSKPFIFGFEDEIGICPTFISRLYAQLLVKHVNAKGHIVVYGPITADRKNFARNWLETFSDDFGLARNRFRVFFVKQRGITGAEFWFVPRRGNARELATTALQLRG